MSDTPRRFEALLEELAAPAGELDSATREQLSGEWVADRFRVGRLLGRGGMGEVYQAVDEQLGRTVAIKRMWRGDGHASRLLQEGRAAARIRHPNVVQIHDVLQHEGSVYLVLEYLSGESLARRMRAGSLSLEETLEIVGAAIEGVVAAHALGILHRDIKPDNIFLTEPAHAEDGGGVKVLDFGIAKSLDAAGNDLSLTASGVAVGTPLYMASEQLEGRRDLDQRVDVYAFGAVLYEALTGQLPFLAEGLGALAVRQATSQPRPPSELCGGLPSALDAVVLRALSRDRDARQRSLLALRDELKPFRRATHAAGGKGDGSNDTTVRARTTRGWRRAGVWAALTAALVVGLWMAWREDAAPKTRKPSDGDGMAPEQMGVAPSPASPPTLSSGSAAPPDRGTSERAAEIPPASSVPVPVRTAPESAPAAPRSSTHRATRKPTPKRRKRVARAGGAVEPDVGRAGDPHPKASQASEPGAPEPIELAAPPEPKDSDASPPPDSTEVPGRTPFRAGRPSLDDF